MAIQHRDIVDPQQHEPKDISTASAKTVYRADGAGSGDWESIDRASLNQSDIKEFIEESLDDGSIDYEERFMLTVVLPDVSDATSFVIVPVPEEMYYVGAQLVLGGAITVDDAEVSFLEDDDTPIGDPVLIEFDGSAEGDQYAHTPVGGEFLIEGPTYIKIVTDGASTDTQPVFITLGFERRIAA